MNFYRFYPVFLLVTQFGSQVTEATNQRCSEVVTKVVLRKMAKFTGKFTGVFL